VPAYWPGGVRHGGGVSLVCGVRAEQGKVLAETVRAGGSGRARGSALNGCNRIGVEYRRVPARRTGSY